MIHLGKINRVQLIEMLSKGAQEVVRNKDKINSINVFPVPDADTGSNLARTLEFLANESSKELEIDKILNQTLESAQGNSGIMLTAYLSGFLTVIKKQKDVDFENLTRGFRKAAASARAAVELPKDGTMLDVMDAFCDEFSKNTSIKDSLEASKESLIETESKMKILEASHVVDAGALGFTIFIYGFFNEEFDFEDIDMAKIKVKKEDFGDFPYEVVFVVKNCSFKIDELRNMFSSLGDSLDIVEIEDKVKLHIHTAEPDLVCDTATLVGEVESIARVDMRTVTVH